MATLTPTYGLKKPSLSDNYSVEDQNSNMDIIDTELKKANAKVDLQKNDLKSLNKIIKSVTILTAGWTLDSTLNLYKYRIENSNITVDTVVRVNIRLADLEKASDFKSANESFNGYVEIYSKNIPTSSIICDIVLTGQVI